MQSFNNTEGIDTSLTGRGKFRMASVTISHAYGSWILRSNLMACPLSHRNLRSPTRVRRWNRDASSFPPPAK